MKILQVIGGGEKGGSRSYIIELCKGLKDAGHTVEIVCFLEDVVAASAREHNISAAVLTMRNIFDLGAVSKLRKHIRRERPDLVHTHGVRANFVGRLAAKSTDVPVVTTVHSSVYQDYAHPLKKLFYHRIEKMTRRYTDRFIAVAGSLRDELKEDGVACNKIDVVYNGINPDFTAAAGGPPLREELGISPGIPILITIGRMEPVKNQEMLLRVFAHLKQKGIVFHAVLVGDGPLAAKLQNTAAALQVKDCVSFLGFRKDICRLLSGADVFLLTSRMEGLPITLLEAMAVGIPVVVTGVGGMPEAIRLAENGWTVEVDNVEQCAEKVCALLENANLRQQMAHRGQLAAQEYFSDTAFLAKTLAVYNKALVEGVSK